MDPVFPSVIRDAFTTAELTSSDTPPSPKTPKTTFRPYTLKDSPHQPKGNEVPPRLSPDSADELNKSYAREAEAVLIGPMPVELFLNHFLPPIPIDNPMPNAKRAFNKVNGNVKDEKDLYSPLVCFHLLICGIILTVF